MTPHVSCNVDEIDESDTFDIHSDSHSHLNLGFSRIGFYAVTFVARELLPMAKGPIVVW